MFDEDSPLADALGFRKDVLEAMKRIKCPVFRWSEGNFASAYHWENGTGQKEKWPQILDDTWGG